MHSVPATAISALARTPILRERRSIKRSSDRTSDIAQPVSPLLAVDPESPVPVGPIAPPFIENCSGNAGAVRNWGHRLKFVGWAADEMRQCTDHAGRWKVDGRALWAGQHWSCQPATSYSCGVPLGARIWPAASVALAA